MPEITINQTFLNLTCFLWVLKLRWYCKISFFGQIVSFFIWTSRSRVRNSMRTTIFLKFKICPMNCYFSKWLNPCISIFDCENWKVNFWAFSKKLAPFEPSKLRKTAELWLKQNWYKNCRNAEKKIAKIENRQNSVFQILGLSVWETWSIFLVKNLTHLGTQVLATWRRLSHSGDAKCTTRK